MGGCEGSARRWVGVRGSARRRVGVRVVLGDGWV